jgi:hypothetical protein
MFAKYRFSIVFLLILLLASATAIHAQGNRRSGARTRATKKTVKSDWFFAVSGDSRDCGDLIMPKIAKSIETRRMKAPVQLYWHLGDLRALYRIDCDIAKRMNPSFNCMPTERSQDEITTDEKRRYLNTAWDDFIKNQATPFARSKIQFFLGIGNHEVGTFNLGGGVEKTFTRDGYRRTFRQWLVQKQIERQRQADRKNGNPSKDGDTYYHFVQGGVDFIYLDNADANVGFSNEQIEWLSKVLAADAKDKSVRTIAVGMHAALPQSISRGHAMDATCPSFCSGMRVYDMLQKAQKLDGPLAKRKYVYVFASHSHYFEEDIYNTQEHAGKVLPGWIIGTGGAEQYRDTIMYGYLQVKVRRDGMFDTQFIKVTRESPPQARGKGAAQLTDFCFENNKKPSSNIIAKDCACSGTQ